MVIKIKTGKDDLHSNNIMYEDSATAKVVDGFFGIPTKKEKPEAPDTASLQKTEEQKTIEKAAAGTAATKEEKQNPSEDYNDNSTTNTNKSEAEKSLDIWLAQIWKDFISKAKSYPQDFQSYVNIAIPSKFEKGTLFLDVPTCFAKESIENNYLRMFTDELSMLSSKIIQQISIQCSSDAKNEEQFFAKVHKPFVKDNRLIPTAYRVYAAVLFYRNNKTGICRASIRQISDDFNIPKTVVERGLNDLIDKGYVIRNEKGFKFMFFEDREA